MRTLLIAIVASLAVGLGGVAQADDVECQSCNARPRLVAGLPHLCAICGRQAECKQVECKVVAGTRKVTKVCWDVKCEPIAPVRPGRCSFVYGLLGSLNQMPSLRLGQGGCSSCGQVACQKCQPPEVEPECGKARCRKILVRKVIEVEVPVYRCEVKWLCNECLEEQGEEVKPSEAEKAEMTTPAPLPPLTHVNVSDYDAGA